MAHHVHHVHHVHDKTQSHERLPLRLGDLSRQHSHPLDLYKPLAHLDAHVQQQQTRKRCPDTLALNPNAFRLRSRTDSTRSSFSSAHVPDSATTCSTWTLASPLSSNYASEIQEQLAAHTLCDGPTPPRRIRHGHQPSSVTTCSTFINDDDVPVVDVTPSDIAAKLRQLHDDLPQPLDVWDDDSSGSPLTDRGPRGYDGGARQAFCDHCLTRKPSTASSLSDAEDEDHDGDDNDMASRVHQTDIDSVLDYTLQAVYGVELRDSLGSRAMLRQLGFNFIHGLGMHIEQSLHEANGGQTTKTTSSSSTSTPSQATCHGGIRGGSSGKRKKQAGGYGDKGDDFSDGETSGHGPAKRIKPTGKDEDNLRLSCPYRKRNPRRFNVRDHHSCAMTYFPKFAELRQHIVKQHKREFPSAFVCDRCTREFKTRKELRDHQRQPREHMCEVSDHDAESGIDASTAIRLVSRKRASGTSAETQWREIWSILFPDDDDAMVRPYDFTPVIEHFELSSQFLDSFDLLQSSLRNKISNPATLETLATKFHQCFVEAVDSCASVARRMPYANRSNKRNNEQAPAPQPRKAQGIVSRPDSGVIMADDGSEESGSVFGHRDSIRSVAASMRQLRPAPPSAADYLSLPQLASCNSIQSWSSGVLLDNGMQALGWSIPDCGVNSQGVSYQTDFGGETQFRGDWTSGGDNELRADWAAGAENNLKNSWAGGGLDLSAHGSSSRS
ncbi:hypothetical protein CDD81_4561 [Ophiocordyceps australis]|uniref:C2H2-type domain-containing protein n=1 Tax=Ophiocordyceps australis TaxID=1399860 RepID=A0A2C5Y9U2_9HYPO|nr:hypothetical protein CDD81_4561 [Ophiocordyceps australis]